MVLPVEEVLKLIADNVRRAGAPISVSPETCSGWARGLDLPKGGETVLYTGCLYQLVPYIDALTKQLESLEAGRAAGIAMRLVRAVAKVVDLSKLVVKVPREELERQYGLIRGIAALLKKAGVSFGYLYEDDVYSGALLYDLGMDELFAEHARKVYSIFKRNGVKRVITVDPHSLHVLRSVYPGFVEGYDLEVVSYLELLDEKGLEPARTLEGSLTIHDPCFYARYENVVEQPRRLLSKLGLEIKEPPRTKNLTFCCGGPVESIAPRMARRIAEVRVAELAERSDSVVVMCPICYANLSRAAEGRLRVVDVSELLAKGYGVGGG